jgi:hypothetical protein
VSKVQQAQPIIQPKQVTLKSVPPDLWLSVKLHAMKNGETVPEFMIRAAKALMKSEAA